MNDRGGYRRFGYENDNMEERLSQKTSILKQITLDLSDELKKSKGLLNDLDSDFEKNRSFVRQMISKVAKLPKYGDCKLYFQVILFCLFVFIVLYLVVKWR